MTTAKNAADEAVLTSDGFVINRDRLKAAVTNQGGALSIGADTYWESCAEHGLDKELVTSLGSWAQLRQYLRLLRTGLGGGGRGIDRIGW